jgi:hypothetical protein
MDDTNVNPTPVAPVTDAPVEETATVVEESAPEAPAEEATI